MSSVALGFERIQGPSIFELDYAGLRRISVAAPDSRLLRGDDAHRPH